MGVLKRTIFSCLTGALLYSLLCYGQDDNLSAQLPNSLLECYQNTSLYYRGNRLPHSMDVFIDLVRKIEAVPNLNMDMRELVVALLHRFRLDGVVYDSSVQYTEGVLPFSVKGPQMYKNQIILRYLVQGNAYHFPNDSLSSLEKCSLHFMMSSSIDATQRGDESQSCQTYRNNQYKKKYRRSATDEEVVTSKFLSTIMSVINETPDTENTEGTPVFELDTDHWWNTSELEEDVTPNLSETEIEENPTATEDDGVTTTTTVAIEKPVVAERAFKQMAEVQIVPDSETVKAVSSGEPVSGKLTYPRLGAAVDGPTSECPIENGVVSTRWGSVNLGNLLAGIAAGLNPLNVRTTELNQRSSSKTPVYDGQMDNKFAATFAGDLAEVALNQGSVKNTLDVGSPGQWNSSFIPQWYFIDGRLASDITDAELRGDLDGLILATKVKSWYDLSNKQLTLSALLDMYYNRNKGIYDSPQYIACRRKELFTEVAETELLKTQTRLFSLVLNRRLPTPGTVTDQKIFEFADNAVNALIGYIPSNLDSNMKCDDSRSLNTRVSSDASTVNRDPQANIILIIDTNYDLYTAKYIIAAISNSLRVTKHGSNITVVSGSDGVTLVKGDDFVEIFPNISTPEWDQLYNSRERGLHLATVLQNITQTNLTERMETLKRFRRISDSRTVVLVIPSQGYSINNDEYSEVYEIIQRWKDRIPIARLLFACQNCQVQNYEHMVFDSQHDILSLQEISNTKFDTSSIVNRVTELTQPIINPECGSTFPKKGKSENVDSFVDYLDEDYGKIYSIHPKYFYGIDTTIRVKALGFSYGQLRVCSWVGPSEIVSTVGFNSTNDSSESCQTVDSGINKEWAISNPCSTSSSVDNCGKSIYVSVAVVKTSNRCFDAACGGEIWKVKFGLVATGLHCSGASSLAASILLIVTALLTFLRL